MLKKIANLLKTGNRNNIELAYQLSVSTQTSLWTLERGIKDLLYYSKTQPSIHFDNLPLGQLCFLLNNIIALSISKKDLDLIPEQLYFLNALVILEIDSVPLQKLPDSLGELSDLKSLSIKNTNIKTLPSSIGQLRKLERLSLVDNPFLLTLTKELFQLKNLKVLYLSHSLLPALEGQVFDFEVITK